MREGWTRRRSKLPAASEEMLDTPKRPAPDTEDADAEEWGRKSAANKLHPMARRTEGEMAQDIVKMEDSVGVARAEAPRQAAAPWPTLYSWVVFPT